MKKVLSITVIAAIGMMMLFSSCKKEEVETAPLPTSTIIGKVKADLDQTNANPENAPAGTKIFFRINSQQLALDPLPNYVYQTLQYETTVDASGEYTITLPCATHQAVNVTIVPNDFRYTRITGPSTTADYYFQGGQQVVTIRDSETNYVDLFYN
jgi:hypothetical protein